MPSTLGRQKNQAKLSPPVALTKENDDLLPTDVLYEVLLRLSAKELCRLRVVCRSWRSLTSDPVFAKAHASRHPSLLVAGIWKNREVHILDLTCGCPNIIRRLHVPHHVYDLSIAQLGLICASPDRGDLNFVLDPVAGEVVATLPDGGIDVDLQQDDGSWFPLGLGRVQSCMSYRGSSRPLLGHVPSTGEYKALRTNGYHMVWDGGQELITQKCQVITVSGCTATAAGSGAKRWRARPCPPVGDPSTGLRGRVVVDGVAYFLRRPSNDYRYHIDIEDIEPDAIFAFDLVTEVWRPNTLRGPLSSNCSDNELKFSQERETESLQLCALDGCLVTAHHKNWDCSMDLWFLEDMDDIDKGLWNKRYSIRPAPGCKYRHSFRPPYPLHVLEDRRIVMWGPEPESLVMALGVYNPRTNMYTKLASMQEYSSVSMYLGSLLYSPVLQS